MSNSPLSYLPGVCKVDSAYADSIQASYNAGRPAAGRITDMDKSRFIAGLPEKIGGWAKTVQTQMNGTPRGMRDWRDFNQVIYMGIGTSSKLYYFSQGSLHDITPLRAVTTGTLTNPFDTTSSSATVTVHHTAHGQQTNDIVMLVASAAVGGITIAGVFHITVLNANTYTITNSTAATSTVSGGGGFVAYTYYRTTLTNPFSTVSGSSTVTVTEVAHGATVGDYVEIAGASAVGGVTPSGEYIILSADSDHYTIDVGTPASSTATGGGTPTIQFLISSGLPDSLEAFGYGTGGYGGNGYGTTGNSSVFLAARMWSLAKYGQQLLANPAGGTIYIWDPIIQGRAYPMYGAPAVVNGMFVTPERFVMALGTSGNAMLVQWPDQSNYNDWVPTLANTANQRTLQEGSYLVNGLPIRDGVSLIWSNTNCYAFTYTGDNEVYNSETQGDKNGLIGPLAMCALGGVAFWMSQTKELWEWNGSATPMLSDDIRDYIFNDINLTQATKCVVASNVQKKEIWFFYPSAASTEIDRYVIFHIGLNCWSCGTMQRTSFVDRTLFPYPMATDANGYLYNHEYGHDADGAAMDAYLTFSPVDISKGDLNMDITGYVPDTKRQTGDMSLYVNTSTYPQETPTVNGPYTIAGDGSTPIIDLRLGAKLVSFKLESNVVGGDFRVGMPRIQVTPAGARR